MSRSKRRHLVTRTTGAVPGAFGMSVDPTPCDERLPTSMERRTRSVVGSLATSFEQLHAENERLSVLTLKQAGPSIAPKILEVAIGDTANFSGGPSCARLYLAMQGMAIPVADTTTGMDLQRLDLWLQAMAEHATGRWRGSERGMKAIAAAYPLIWQQAQAATKAWEKTNHVEDAGSDREG